MVDLDWDNCDQIDGVPERLLQLYVDCAMAKAKITHPEPGLWMAVVDELWGNWGSGTTRSEAEQDLRSSIVGWIEIKRRYADGDIPVLDGIDLNGEIEITTTTS